MLQVALFRSRQRERKSWIEQLRSSGYDIKFVHDPDRITGETNLVVIDTSVERWKEYVRLFLGQGAPIVLLVDSDTRFSAEELTLLGAAGTVTQEEETDRVFHKFLHPSERHPTDQFEHETQVAFPQYGRTLALTAAESSSKESEHADLINEPEKEPESTAVETKSEPIIQQREATGGTLSQRKASRQSSAEHSSNGDASAIRENSGCDSEQAALQNGDLSNLQVTEHKKQIGPVPLSSEPSCIMEDEEREPPDHRAKAPQWIADEDEEVWPEDSVRQSGIQQPVKSEAARSRDLPSVAAVYAAKGGVGKTAFLLHLAALLSKEGRRVCVLDLDLMHGTLASMLRIQPNKTIVDLAYRIDDPKASRACLLQTKMGFSIVAAPLQPGTFRLQREQLTAILRFLKEETDIVLIDTPVHFDSLIKLALEQSEQLFLMTTDEPASMESLARMKPLFGSLRPTPELYTIWNRLSDPVPKEQRRDLLPWPVMVELPEDPTVGKAVRSGQWITSSPCSPYRLRVKQLADRWLGVETERPDAKRNLLRRLLFDRI
ncbi:AAA family ATPase [Ferviditalea candida]|uniref:AAA family ATPase n=1 Tax=Ferviditalea candida TaxID=3108399 RepID=A0ABU5ZKV4_9BACL|nr:AAA family ATPase [Paenibacillaceae bacterium T2]